MRCPDRLTIFALLFLVFVFSSFRPVLAQTATPAPTLPAATPTITPTPAGGLSGGLVPTVPVGWVESPAITEVGRNAERARELLGWTFSHPPIYNHPILASMWTVSRNVAYVFVVFTIVMFAVGFVMAQRRGGTFNGISFAGNSQIISVLFKIAGVLLFITFSYYVLLLIMQSSELLMRFFIERVGGKDLFNIFFVGGGGTPNTEKNYTDFFGYLNFGARQANLEMINTSIFMIRLTSLTYNIMAVMLILRHVILWLLLIISPFLALLLPFIFIRNTGWIWIGVFFQWVFYGPLFALFLAGLTQIWVAGIPYSFDFGRTPAIIEERVQQGQARVDACGVTPFKTSINILYGGPAQKLDVCNSANYIDTYAEYVVSLIMLWAVTFLPWLLLRIFRDYCCDILAQNQAVLVQMLDRLRSFGQPPPAPVILGPTATSGQARELPFRHAVSTPSSTAITKITEIERNIENVRTNDIVSAMNLSVSSIQDVARLDISHRQQEEKRTSLESLRAPASVSDRSLRESYSSIRSELFSRASQGDRVAQRVVAAAEQRVNELARADTVRSMVRPMTTPEVAQKVGVSEAQVQTVLATIPVMGRPSSERLHEASAKANVSLDKVSQIVEASRPSKAVSPATVIAGRALTTAEIAQKVQISEEKVHEILSSVHTIEQVSQEQVSKISQKVGVPAQTVEQVLALARPATIETIIGKTKIAMEKAREEAPPVTVDDYEDVKEMWVNHYRNSDIPVSEKIQSREQWLEEDSKKLANVINLLASSDLMLKKQGMSEVSAILPFLLLGGFSDSETIIYLKAKRAAAEQVLKETKVAMEIQEGKKEEQEELVEVGEKKTEQVAGPMVLEQVREQKISSEDKKFQEQKQVVSQASDESHALSSASATKQVTTLTELVRNITNVRTEDIVSALSLSITDITHLAQVDMKKTQEQEKLTNLEFLRLPENLPDQTLKQQYTSIRNELSTRAQEGDQLAQQVMAAVEGRISVPASSYIVVPTTPEVAQKVGVSEQQVSTILTMLPPTQIATQERLGDIAIKVGLSKDKLNDILTMARPQTSGQIAPTIIIQIAKQLTIPEEKVKAVLTAFPLTVSPTTDQIQTVARANNITAETFQRIRTIAQTAKPTKLGQPEQVEENLAQQTLGGGKKPVSVDNYEEVKSMWANHYRKGDIPLSDKITTREQWLDEDIHKLQAVITRIASSDAAVKQQGMSELTNILPFLLLGGFSDQEILVYLKAKLVAAEEVKKTVHTDYSEQKDVLSVGQRKVDVPKDRDKDKDEENMVEIENQTEQTEDQMVEKAE